MVIRQLDHLNLTVHSLDETLDFYRRVFGFEKVEEGLYNGLPWMILRAEDALLCMYEHSDAEMPGPGVHQVNHFALRVGDVQAWVQTLEREAVQVRYGGVVQWPHSRSWYVLDPTGHEIEVVAWNEDVVRF